MKVSIVIVARSSAEPALRCVKSLRTGLKQQAIEIILVDGLGPLESVQLKEAGADAILTVDSQWKITHQRAAGARMGTGEIVAVLNERYEASAAWVGAVLDAYIGEYDVISGPVAPATHLKNVEWAMYLSEYWHMCAPIGGDVTAREAIMFPSGNIAYRRHILDLDLMSSAAGEFDLHAALLRAGARFCREPRMLVSFATPPGVPEYVAERFAVSLEFAAARAMGTSVVRRLFAAVARFALPALVIWRIGYAVFRGRCFRAKFLAALPWIVLFATVQMTGEMWGYARPRPR